MAVVVRRLLRISWHSRPISEYPHRNDSRFRAKECSIVSSRPTTTDNRQARPLRPESQSHRLEDDTTLAAAVIRVRVVETKLPMHQSAAAGRIGHGQRDQFCACLRSALVNSLQLDKQRARAVSPRQVCANDRERSRGIRRRAGECTSRACEPVVETYAVAAHGQAALQITAWSNRSEIEISVRGAPTPDTGGTADSEKRNWRSKRDVELGGRKQGCERQERQKPLRFGHDGQAFATSFSRRVRARSRVSIEGPKEKRT